MIDILTGAHLNVTYKKQTHDGGPCTFGFAQCQAYKTSSLSTTNMLPIIIKIILRILFTIIMRLTQKYTLLWANKSSVVYGHFCQIDKRVASHA